MPDGAQPGAPQEGAPEGQGTEGQDQGLYAEILDGIPEEHHQSLTDRLKAKDADFTKRFQGVSEQWKPYEDLGIKNYDPEGLGGWLNQGVMLQAAAEGDPEAVEDAKAWVSELASTLGVEMNGGEEEGGSEESLFDLSPDKLKDMVGSQVAEQVNPLLERMEAQQQEALRSEAEQEVSDQLGSLRKENPNLTDDDERYILALAWQFGQESEDPITAGFEEFKKLVARGENELFAQKANQPRPAEGAGRPDSSYEAPSTFEEAAKAAKQRFAQTAGT